MLESSPFPRNPSPNPSQKWRWHLDPTRSTAMLHRLECHVLHLQRFNRVKLVVDQGLHLAKGVPFLLRHLLSPRRLRCLPLLLLSEPQGSPLALLHLLLLLSLFLPPHQLRLLLRCHREQLVLLLRLLLCPLRSAKLVHLWRLSPPPSLVRPLLDFRLSSLHHLPPNPMIFSEVMMMASRRWRSPP